MGLLALGAQGLWAEAEVDQVGKILSMGRKNNKGGEGLLPNTSCHINHSAGMGDRRVGVRGLPLSLSKTGKNFMHKESLSCWGLANTPNRRQTSQY